MNIGICSFSFHRLYAAGQHDIFRFITDCKNLGCTQLDPWNAHLSTMRDPSSVLTAGHNPHMAHHHLSAADEQYIQRVRSAAGAAGLPFGTIAVDGAHIYEADPEARQANRLRARRWLEIAHMLGATQIRIDAGGPEEMPPDVFQIIKDGYRDLIDRAAPLGIEILVENHWGPSTIPDNVSRLIEQIPGLGLLYDTYNWKPELRAQGRRQCARYARATHIKTFAFDHAGNETTDAPEIAIQCLLDAGYSGTWGIESTPHDGDELAAADKTIQLIRRRVRQA